jgi:hypothetical protein
VIQQSPDQEVKQFAATVEAALRTAVAEALQAHKRAGNSVAVWQDDRVVTLTADQIPDQAVEQADDTA